MVPGINRHSVGTATASAMRPPMYRVKAEGADLVAQRIVKVTFDRSLQGTHVVGARSKDDIAARDERLYIREPESLKEAA